MAENMKGAEMPQERFERKEKSNAPVCGEKYGTEMGNPKEMDGRTSGLANYAKSHKPKH
jgi:hypothetical protein